MSPNALPNERRSPLNQRAQSVDNTLSDCSPKTSQSEELAKELAPPEVRVKSVLLYCHNLYTEAFDLKHGGS